MAGSSDLRQRRAADVAVAWDSLQKPVFRKLAVKWCTIQGATADSFLESISRQSIAKTP